MMGSLDGNGLVLLGLWWRQAWPCLLFLGLLSWEVVSILSRHGFERRWTGTTEDRGPGTCATASAMT
jgi:hypothetical protein